jgi:hypothetical protein
MKYLCVLTRKTAYFINRRLAPATSMIPKASSRRNRSIKSRNFQMWIRWRRAISLEENHRQYKIKNMGKE